MESLRVLVAYASKHGGTEEIARRIAHVLRSEGVRVDVGVVSEVGGVSQYDALVLGGALYMGRWLRPARRFARRFARDFRGRPVWLFSSGPIDDSATAQDLVPVPDVQRAIRRLDARDHVTFGGRLAEEPDDVLGRMLAEKMHGDFRDWKLIDAWTKTVAAELIALGFDSEPLVSGGTE
jgi:menaquinone-dependent protoporphyrinogen oxidase